MTNPIMDEVRRRYLTPDVQKQVDLQVMIANRVYDLMEERGWSQCDLAQHMGETEQEINRWLCGTHNLTIATIARLAVVLEDDLIVSTKSSKRKKVSLQLPINKMATL